jgi:hypothetical protein
VIEKQPDRPIELIDSGVNFREFNFMGLSAESGLGRCEAA